MYKIGQAAKLLDVKPFVLRFWEGEFQQVLVPVRTPSGQRAYTESNLATVREIKRLLYDEGLTIEGAKKRLLTGSAEDASKRAAPEPAQAEPLVPAPAAQERAAQGLQPEILREVARELAALRDLLS
jgi:DNA-binding transcriptional MerR regulator